MLYLSTRNALESYTAGRVLTESRAPDGGLYVPLSLEPFPSEILADLTARKFNDTVARMMNILFQCQITEHDVRLCVGKHPVRLAALSNRILAGECWHNLEGSYPRLVQNLVRHICPQGTTARGSWTEVGVGACVIFGIFSELMVRGLAGEEKKVDVSLVSGDFSMAMSVWYARAWGLPIGNIICCCNENNAVWNLFAHGQLRTDGISIPTSTPEADICVPDSLERLIFACGGGDETNRYVERCRRAESYYPEDSVLAAMRRGMYVSVVSSRRILDTIPNAYTTHGYLLSHYSALAYAGLMDFRAKTGESRTALILAEKSPMYDPDTVAAALGITVEELEKRA